MFPVAITHRMCELYSPFTHPTGESFSLLLTQMVTVFHGSQNIYQRPNGPKGPKGQGARRSKGSNGSRDPKGQGAQKGRSTDDDDRLVVVRRRPSSVLVVRQLPLSSVVRRRRPSCCVMLRYRLSHPTLAHFDGTCIARPRRALQHNASLLEQSLQSLILAGSSLKKNRKE